MDQFLHKNNTMTNISYNIVCCRYYYNIISGNMRATQSELQFLAGHETLVDPNHTLVILTTCLLCWQIAGLSDSHILSITRSFWRHSSRLYDTNVLHPYNDLITRTTNRWVFWRFLATFWCPTFSTIYSLLFIIQLENCQFAVQMNIVVVQVTILVVFGSCRGRVIPAAVFIKLSARFTSGGCSKNKWISLQIDNRAPYLSIFY